MKNSKRILPTNLPDSLLPPILYKARKHPDQIRIPADKGVFYGYLGMFYSHHEKNGRALQMHLSMLLVNPSWKSGQSIEISPETVEEVNYSYVFIRNQYYLTDLDEPTKEGFTNVIRYLGRLKSIPNNPVKR